MFCFRLNVCVSLLYLLPLVLSQEYLYRKGYVVYRLRGQTKKEVLVTINVNHVDSHSIPNLSSAVSLKIEGYIPILYQSGVRNLPNLKRLSLPNCRINNVKPGAFQNLQRLKNLHLQENNLEEIEEGIFNYMNIEYLYLQRNKIHIIRSGAFDNMPSLRKIHLNSNSLTKWDVDWFKNTPNLILLYFRRNQISEIPAKAFVNLRSSHTRDGLKNTTIYLSKNIISYIHPQAFENIHFLRELWLDRNMLEEIDNTVFSRFTTIKRLLLQKNRITQIDRYAFKELQTMLELNLSSNRNLTCIEYEMVVNINTINLEGDNIYCSCLYNLKEKLHENGSSRNIRIITPKMCLDDQELSPDDSS